MTGTLWALRYWMGTMTSVVVPPARATVPRNMRTDRTESCGRRPLAREARDEP